MVLAAVWLQTTDVQTDYMKYIMIFVGIIAAAFAVQAIGVVVIAMRALVVMKDIKSSFDEAKVKAVPIMTNLYGITLSTQEILADLTPKIKIISENVTETTHTVRQAVDKIDVSLRQSVDKATVTFDDANFRTQRQVARVDSMVASTLAATAELGATINHGIRVPARKIAEMMTHSKHLIDTLVDRAKAVGAGVSAFASAQKSPTKHEDINRVDW
jgi:uncharacterized protein YoxC